MRSDTSGHFRRLLMSLLAGSRNEKLTVDKAGAAETARSLYKAGVGRLGTDEPTFNAVIASQSQMQLRAVFDEYSKQFGHDIEKAIKLEMSGDLADGMLAVGKSDTRRKIVAADYLDGDGLSILNYISTRGVKGGTPTVGGAFYFPVTLSIKLSLRGNEYQ